MSDKDEPMFTLKADWEGIRLIKADWIAANANKPVPWSEFDKQTKLLSRRTIKFVFDALGPVLKEAVDIIGGSIMRLDKNLKAAEAALAEATHRLNELELAREKTIADAFRGSWLQNEYKRGNLVVHQGSLWLCMADTGEKPGTTSAWKMITQKGRDAVPAR